MLFQRFHGARGAGREAVQLRGGLVLLRGHSLVHRQEETALEVGRLVLQGGPYAHGLGYVDISSV